MEYTFTVSFLNPDPFIYLLYLYLCLYYLPVKHLLPPNCIDCKRAQYTHRFHWTCTIPFVIIVVLLHGVYCKNINRSKGEHSSMCVCCSSCDPNASRSVCIHTEGYIQVLCLKSYSFAFSNRTKTTQLQREVLSSQNVCSIARYLLFMYDIIITS